MTGLPRRAAYEIGDLVYPHRLKIETTRHRFAGCWLRRSSPELP